MTSVSCTFFGHRDCPQTIKPALREAILELIGTFNVTRFFVGNHGNFDAYCREVLKELGANYSVVLSRMPGKSGENDNCSDTLLPEGIVENGPPQFAIERRNRWMLENSDYVICYLNRTHGGAAKFVSMAQRMGKTVIRLEI